MLANQTIPRISTRKPPPRMQARRGRPKAGSSPPPADGGLSATGGKLTTQSATGGAEAEGVTSDGVSTESEGSL